MNPWLEDFRPYAYLIVLVGLVLAAWGALLPHYDAGYRLDGTRLVALMLPFVACASLTESLRPGWLAAAGAVILAATVAVAVSLRTPVGARSGEPLAIALPLLVALVVLTVAYLLGRRREP